MTDTETQVTITVNGEAVACRPGELVIDAAQRAGAYIPRFCYHERMKPVGMCRMCLVDIDGGRGPALQPSCMVPVADGMSVDTNTDRAKRAQEGILEMLLINHPLDCPVCDKGGECPLQDQTVAYGPGESRFVEEKRHYEKPIAISDLVYLDRERCILCDRCTRFARDVAGDPLIHFIDRGNATQVNTFPDHPFASYFSGNTVQICPVGALTAEPYRFKARPWDLTETESTSTIDTSGARVVLQSSRDRLVRVLGLDSDAVNWGWLSDKERFAYEAAESDDRLLEPQRRDGDELVSTRWSDAARSAADALKGKKVGVIGGARLPVEGQFAWRRLLDSLPAACSVDAQLDDGLPAEVVLGLPRTTIGEAFAPGSVVVTVGADLKEEIPTVFLRLRHAALEDGVSVIEVHPRSTALSPLAAVSLRPLPGTVGQVATALGADAAPTKAVGGVEANQLATARDLLASGRPVTVVYGRSNLAESADFTVDALGALHRALPEARFLPALRRGNLHGALEVGLGAGHGPAGPVDVPHVGARAILQAVADGKLDTLVLLGADPLGDLPDRELAERALKSSATVVAVDLFLTESSAQADLVLPAAAAGEVDGSFLNLEGRLSPLAAKITPPGQTRADWMIAAEIALAAGDDLGFGTLAECRDALSASVAAFSSVDWSALAAADDGSVLDLSRSWKPRFADPVVVPPVDGYGLRLVVDRKLWDNGVLCQKAESLTGLAREATLELPLDVLDGLGLSGGDTLLVEGEHGKAELVAVPSAALPRGVARIVYGQAGADPRPFLTGGDAVTEIRVSAR